MGRKSSAKDRAYITQSERKDGYGSIRSGGGAGNQNSSAVARRAALVSLPFTHCRLTCERWIDPVCSPDGDVFDVTAAVPAIRASGGRNPLTGEALALKDLVRLHYHRVGDPSASASASSSSSLPPFGCPVTGKEFTPSSHIVAIRTTGNVFSFDAVERLNLKAKNLRDLLDDTPFTKSDVIHLQDPADVSGTAAARAEKMSRAAAVGLGSIGASKKAAAAGAAAAADAPPSPSLDPNGGSSNLDASALGKDAQRILARIQASSSSMGPGGPAAGGRGDRGASRLPGSDPRLRAPERERVAAPAFKAGAATWDTSGDDSSQQQLTLQMRKAAEKRRRREEAEEEARKVKEANGIAKRGEEKKAPAPYGEKVFERLALAAKAAAAASARPVAFTSSVTPLVSAPPSKNAALDLIPKPPRFRRARVEKGYCRLSTSLGDLNLELFADAAPRAVENFVVLAQAGYYDGCVFHRSVRNFMAQSGDPTGTGRGGESIYGGPFPFEGPGAKSLGCSGGGNKGGSSNNNPPSPSTSSLSHDARGVLAMANPGDRDANGSQFYILYKSALHLDGKHTVFGRVAGGLATLDAIEKVPTDAKDRPLTPVVIEGVEVFVDPFARKAGEESEDEDEEEETEVEKEAKRARAAADEAEKEEEGRKRARWFSGPAPVAEARSGGVGRYLGSAAAAGGAAAAAAAAAVPQQQQARAAPPPAAKKKFGNFDAW